jgi:hypothetical protein
MCREEVRGLFDADFFWDRPKRIPETFNGFLGFEDVEDTEPVRPFSSGVESRPSKGRSAGDSIRVLPVRRRTTCSYFFCVRLGV